MPQGLSVLDVENLRLHYEKTLSHWLHRFNDAADTVARMFDEHLRTGMAVVSRRLAGRVQNGIDAALSSGVRPRRHQPHSVDTRERIAGEPWTVVTF